MLTAILKRHEYYVEERQTDRLTFVHGVASAGAERDPNRAHRGGN